MFNRSEKCNSVTKRSLYYQEFDILALTFLKTISASRSAMFVSLWEELGALRRDWPLASDVSRRPSVEGKQNISLGVLE